MDLDKIDWAALERLRTSFLAGAAGTGDYWREASDLAAYDATFAQRIGWKWDFVLDELVRRGWRPPEGDVLDWGCGSGIAGRRFLAHFSTGGTGCLHPVSAVTEGGTGCLHPVSSVAEHGLQASRATRSPGALVLHDRSALAMDFAAGRAREEFPAVGVRCEAAGHAAAPTMLISHALGELTDRQLDLLLSQVRSATAVLWVEPGAHEISRRLGSAVRERLRGEFAIMAPCTHQAACGLLALGMERHWCHHFAHTPSEVFMDGNWSRIARLAGIDLRSLPLSFLVLSKRGALPLPPGAVRVIGRPRVHKDAARPFGCDASGVRERRLAKRKFLQEYRACKREDFKTLQDWTLEGDEIVAVR